MPQHIPLFMPGVTEEPQFAFWRIAPVIVEGRDCAVCARYVASRPPRVDGQVFPNGGFALPDGEVFLPPQPIPTAIVTPTEEAPPPEELTLLAQVGPPTVSLPSFAISITRATKPDFQASMRSWFNSQDWGFGLNWLKDTFRDGFTPVIGGVMDTMWGAIRNTQVNLIQSAITGSMGSLLSGMGTGLTNVFSGLADTINAQVVNRFNTALGQLQTNITNTAAGLQSQLNALAGTISTEVQSQVQASINVLTQQIPGMISEGIQASITALTQDLPRMIEEFTAPAIAAVTSAFQESFNFLQEQFGNLTTQVQGLADVVAGVPEMITGALQQAANFTVQQVTALGAQLMGAINTAITALDQNVITPLRQTLEGFISQVQAALAEIGARAAEALALAQQALGQIGGAFVGFGEFLAGAGQFIAQNWPFILAGVIGVPVGLFALVSVARGRLLGGVVRTAVRGALGA